MLFSLFEAMRPDVLYHVTPRADKIMRSGFLPATLHGEGETLGGPAPDAVSFTDNLKTAQDYRDGLEILQKTVRGEFNKSDLHMIGEFYGLSYDEVKKRIKYVLENEMRSEWVQYEMWKQWSPEKAKAMEPQMDKDLVYLFVQGLHLEYNKGRPRRMPWVFKQHADKLKDAKGFNILQISTKPGNGKSGPMELTHHAGEHEWRVKDPQNFDYSTLTYAAEG